MLKRDIVMNWPDALCRSYAMTSKARCFIRRYHRPSKPLAGFSNNLIDLCRPRHFRYGVSLLPPGQRKGFRRSKDRANEAYIRPEVDTVNNSPSRASISHLAQQLSKVTKGRGLLDFCTMNRHFRIGSLCPLRSELTRRQPVKADPSPSVLILTIISLTSTSDPELRLPGKL